MNYIGNVYLSRAEMWREILRAFPGLKKEWKEKKEHFRKTYSTALQTWKWLSYWALLSKLNVNMTEPLNIAEQS